MGNAAGSREPPPKITWTEARYLSAQGLCIAALTGALLGAGHTMLNRMDRAKYSDDRLKARALARGAAGGAVLFSGLYVMSPANLRYAMGFEPVVVGRERAIKAMCKAEQR